MKQPLVSVIITTRNSAKTLPALLRSVNKQTYKYIETIVVDNSSMDDTKEIANLYTKFVFQKGPERSSQRNFGASKAHGEYYLFLDSDMVLGKNIIKDCIDTIKDNDLDIGGIIIPEKSFGQGTWARMKAFEREINEGEKYFEAARFFPKKIFWEVGGYDTKLTGPEDWDLPQRIIKKYKIQRIKSYILHNEGVTSLLGLARKKYYYGLKAYPYLKKHQISIFSTTTVYFLRPAFYRQWKKLFSHPLLAGGMVIMLLTETLYGGCGYLVGKFRNEE